MINIYLIRQVRGVQDQIINSWRFLVQRRDYKILTQSVEFRDNLTVLDLMHHSHSDCKRVFRSDRTQVGYVLRGQAPTKASNPFRGTRRASHQVALSPSPLAKGVHSDP